MARKFTTPRHPEFFVRVVTALRLASGQLSPRNDVERGLLDKLRPLALDASSTSKLVARFDAVPLEKRKQALGPLAEDRALAPPNMGSEGSISGTGSTRDFQIRGNVLERWLNRRSGSTTATPSGGSTERVRPEDVRGETSGTVFSQEVSGTIVYTVRYKGLYCREETDGPFSDEIFVTTAVVTTNQGVNFEGSVVKHPRNTPDNVYGDVDSGEERSGPVVALWKGNSDYFSLVVSLWEHDEGDPDAYRAEIEKLVAAGVKVAESYNKALGEILKALEESIVDLINWIIGTGDDLLSTETAVFTREQIEEIAMSQPTLGDSTSVLYHFDTTHKADGATYDVCFDIDRDPPRPPHVIP